MKAELAVDCEEFVSVFIGECFGRGTVEVEDRGIVRECIALEVSKDIVDREYVGIRDEGRRGCKGRDCRVSSRLLTSGERGATGDSNDMMSPSISN